VQFGCGEAKRSHGVASSKEVVGKVFAGWFCVRGRGSSSGRGVGGGGGGGRGLVSGDARVDLLVGVLDVARALASHRAANQVHDPCAHERADEGDEWKEAELETFWLERMLSLSLSGWGVWLLPHKRTRWLSSSNPAHSGAPPSSHTRISFRRSGRP
jgi:hypothetical protein